MRSCSQRWSRGSERSEVVTIYATWFVPHDFASSSLVPIVAAAGASAPLSSVRLLRASVWRLSVVSWRSLVTSHLYRTAVFQVVHHRVGSHGPGDELPAVQSAAAAERRSAAARGRRNAVCRALDLISHDARCDGIATRRSVCLGLRLER